MHEIILIKLQINVIYMHNLLLIIKYKIKSSKLTDQQMKLMLSLKCFSKFIETNYLQFLQETYLINVSYQTIKSDFV